MRVQASALTVEGTGGDDTLLFVCAHATSAMTPTIRARVSAPINNLWEPTKVRFGLSNGCSRRALISYAKTSRYNLRMTASAIRASLFAVVAAALASTVLVKAQIPGQPAAPAARPLIPTAASSIALRPDAHIGEN